LESAVLAAGTNSRNIIVGTLGSVQRNARRENLYSTLCAHMVVWNVIVIRDENKIFDPGGDRQQRFCMLYAAWRCKRNGQCNGGSTDIYNVLRMIGAPIFLV
jgi:hypothetical protein